MRRSATYLKRSYSALKGHGVVGGNAGARAGAIVIVESLKATGGGRHGCVHITHERRGQI
jgi:hypothetical protein